MKELIKQLNKAFEIKNELMLEVKNEKDLVLLLSKYIQELINTNFEQLLWLLYRIDVAENKVIETINNSKPENASLIIAEMIIERQKEKIETRKKYSDKTNKNDDWIF